MIKKLSSHLKLQMASKDHLSQKVLLLPVHKNKNHWILLAIYPLSKVICCFDSYSEDNLFVIKEVWKFLQSYACYHEINVDRKAWKYTQHTGLWKQQNSVDCGIYMLMNAYALVSNIFPNNYSITNLRYFIAHCCIKLPLRALQYDYFPNKKNLEIDVLHDQLENLFKMKVVFDLSVLKNEEDSINLEKLIYKIIRAQYIVASGLYDTEIDSEDEEEEKKEVHLSYNEQGKSKETNENHLNIDLVHFSSFLVQNSDSICSMVKKRKSLQNELCYRLRTFTVPWKVVVEIFRIEMSIISSILGEATLTGIYNKIDELVIEKNYPLMIYPLKGSVQLGIGFSL